MADQKFARIAGYQLTRDLGVIRSSNRVRLLNLVRRQGCVSRATLATRARLSPPTVCSVVDSLVERGLLVEAGAGESSGGRPPRLVRFRDDWGLVVGVDIGGRSIRFAAADLNGRILLEAREPTQASAGVEVMVGQLLRGVEQVASEAVKKGSRLLAVAVGAPGITDVDEGVVIDAVNLSGWKNVPLRRMLEEGLKAAVVVDNDVNLAALGELWKGWGRDTANLVFIALGTGIGAGVIVNGRLHRGHHWWAGEISHLNLDFREWDRDFSGSGYLESRVGTRGMVERARSLGVLPTEGSELTPRMIFEAARAGNKAAQEVVRELAVLLGTAVANISALLDPACVVFGGGISQAGELLLGPARTVVGKILPTPPQIVQSRLGDRAQIIGAIYLACRLGEVRLYEAALMGFGKWKEPLLVLPSQAVGMRD